jgi:hypothetical protein
VNHLGVEVESSEQIAAASNRFQEANLTVKAEDQTTCCYPLQDKVWVKDPDGAAWEMYTVPKDVETFAASGSTASSVCCSQLVALSKSITM